MFNLYYITTYFTCQSFFKAKKPENCIKYVYFKYPHSFFINTMSKYSTHILLKIIVING